MLSQDDFQVYGNIIEHVEEAGLALADCIDGEFWGNTISFAQDTVAPCQVPPNYSGSVILLWGTHGCRIHSNQISGSWAPGTGAAHAVIFMNIQNTVYPYGNYIGISGQPIYANGIWAGYAGANRHVWDPLVLNYIGANNYY